jgi:CubicO group peptidase (beta-lactamase class C family)
LTSNLRRRLFVHLPVDCRALALIAAACLTAPLTAQTPEPARPIDTAAVLRFADAFLPAEIARRRIPGLVLAVVADGELAGTRGYGAAQLDPRRPVEPERTLFRVASVSKLVTATAVMQLVEQGRLDLHRDVNEYLREFRLPARHGTITLHHLLTHTAGFDERLTGMAARSTAEQQPLRDYLARSMPPTFIEPGRVLSYSNHGLALAGLIVEETSGRRFADYVGEHILEPLGMQSSGFVLSPGAQRERAVAYELAGEKHRALPFDPLQIPPAGGFATTGTDMARFLLAHLRDGAVNDARILQSATIARMHAPQFRQHPDTSGWAYGFWEDRSAGGRALLHNGGGAGYRALVYLLPAHDFGFFLAYNLADRDPPGELQEVFIRKVLDGFVPASPRESAAPAAEPVPSGVSGTYRYVRRARTTSEKFISSINTARVARDGSGALTLTRRPDRPIGLTQIGPSLFRTNDGKGQVAFVLEPGGSPRWMVFNAGFSAVYERVPFLETMALQAAWLATMAVIFLYAVWDAFRRSRWVTGAPALLNLVFMVGFPLAFVGDVAGGMPAFVYGVPATARALLLLPPLSAALTLFAAIALIRSSRRARPSRAELIRRAVILTALVSFVLFAAGWRVLGAASRYN